MPRSGDNSLLGQPGNQLQGGWKLGSERQLLDQAGIGRVPILDPVQARIGAEGRILRSIHLGLMKGPSRWTPPSRGKRHRGAAVFVGSSSAASICSWELVIVVASIVVVPWEAWNFVIVSYAWLLASMKSAPKPPCTCRSINPGSSQPPLPSMTWLAAVAQPRPSQRTR